MKTIQKNDLLQGCVRYGAWTMTGVISFAIVGGLIVAWLASAPLFWLSDRWARAQNNRGNRLGLKPLPMMRRNRRGYAVLLGSILFVLRSAQAQAYSPTLNLSSSTASIWQNGVGEGFKAGTQSINWSTGAGYGVKILGSQQSHDLAFASISYGYMLGAVEGQGHWYRGNWEFRGELFGGGQFSPTSDWFVGLTPHLRYNFATGSRWIPYLDVGTGVSATSIGPPDLSHYFEFNLQGAAGIRWFIRNNLAFSVEARYLHMSCAGINSPNLGLNNVNGMVGFSWFF